MDRHAGGARLEVLDIDADELGAAERGVEADEEEGAISDEPPGDRVERVALRYRPQRIDHAHEALEGRRRRLGGARLALERAQSRVPGEGGAGGWQRGAGQGGGRRARGRGGWRRACARGSPEPGGDGPRPRARAWRRRRALARARRCPTRARDTSGGRRLQSAAYFACVDGAWLARTRVSRAR